MPSHQYCDHTGNSGGRPDRSRESRALGRALLITSLFVVAEFLGGLWTNSLALLADAGHMLTDAAALGLSLFAIWLTRRPPNPSKTYGYFRVEILAALINGVALVLIALGILYEAHERLLVPEPVRAPEMLGIATLGLLVNLYCVRMLHGTHTDNLNVRGAFLHVLGDLLGSIAAILAAAAMILWQWYWVDALVSALVAILICFSAWRLASDAVTILLEGAPSHINVTALNRELSSVPGVESIHDLHVWTLTSGMHAMTCHAVVAVDESRDVLHRMSLVCREQFNVHHTTIQLEDEDFCRGASMICH